MQGRTVGVPGMWVGATKSLWNLLGKGREGSVCGCNERVSDTEKAREHRLPGPSGLRRVPFPGISAS